MDIYANNIILSEREPQLLLSLRQLVSEILDRLMEVSKDRSTTDRTFSSSVSMADAEDITLSLKGDGNAYRRIIEKYQQHIGSIMWRFSRDHRTHEELVQDVFVEAYLSLRTYKSKAPLENWLSRIATRVGYAYWKQNKNKRTTEHLSLEQWDQEIQTVSDRVDPSAAAELLDKLLEQLPPRDRLVITLRYLQECSVKETARRTGWTTAMVRVQTFRAKKKLKKLFIGYDEEIEL